MTSGPAMGWASLREVFAALNRSVRYVVLRNFEQLPDGVVAAHDDIDLLVDDLGAAVSVLGAQPASSVLSRRGGQFLVDVAGIEVAFDLRTTGDGYYDTAWAEVILRRRRLIDGGFYAPKEDDHLDALAYHATIHKRVIPADYCVRIALLACKCGRDDWCLPAERLCDELPRLVREMLTQRNYGVTRPSDPVDYINHHHAGHCWPSARRKLAGLRREVVRGSVALHRWARTFCSRLGV